MDLDACRHCGAQFTRIKNNQRFCSHRCRDEFSSIAKALHAIERHLVTVNEAADLTSRKASQIRYAIRRGQIEPVRFPNGRIMVRRCDLDL
jgi:endogenous inhibitor of DNA gyrase (YacG/DUF329 family)